MVCIKIKIEEMEKICYIFLFQRFYLYQVCILQILSDVEDLYFKDVGINLIYNNSINIIFEKWVLCVLNCICLEFLVISYCK